MGAPSLPELVIVLVIFVLPIAVMVIVNKKNMSRINREKNVYYSEYDKNMIEAFIGSKDESTNLWYIDAFSRFDRDGGNSMKWKWSSWAFFLGPLFLLYRKVYILAVILFFISILGRVGSEIDSVSATLYGIFISILAGGFSTYYVYKKYMVKKEKIEVTHSDENSRIVAMKVAGGPNRWVPWLLIILILLILAAVAIPKLAATADEARTSMHDTLVQEANVHNKKLPKKLDEYTRLDLVTVNKNTLIYHYTILLNSEEIDNDNTVEYKDEMKNSVIKHLCESENVRGYFEKGAIFERRYNTKDEKPFMSYQISKDDCSVK